MQEVCSLMIFGGSDRFTYGGAGAVMSLVAWVSRRSGGRLGQVGRMGGKGIKGRLDHGVGGVDRVVFSGTVCLWFGPSGNRVR